MANNANRLSCLMDEWNGHSCWCVHLLHPSASVPFFLFNRSACLAVVVVVPTSVLRGNKIYWKKQPSARARTNRRSHCAQWNEVGHSVIIPPSSSHVSFCQSCWERITEEVVSVSCNERIRKIENRRDCYIYFLLLLLLFRGAADRTNKTTATVVVSFFLHFRRESIITVLIFFFGSLMNVNNREWERSNFLSIELTAGIDSMVYTCNNICPSCRSNSHFLPGFFTDWLQLGAWVEFRLFLFSILVSPHHGKGWKKRIVFVFCFSTGMWGRGYGALRIRSHPFRVHPSFLLPRRRRKPRNFPNESGVRSFVRSFFFSLPK